MRLYRQVSTWSNVPSLCHRREAADQRISYKLTCMQSRHGCGFSSTANSVLAVPWTDCKLIRPFWWVRWIDDKYRWPWFASMFNLEDGLRLLVVMNVCMIFIVMRLSLWLFLIITRREYFHDMDNIKLRDEQIETFPGITSSRITLKSHDAGSTARLKKRMCGWA